MRQTQRSRIERQIANVEKKIWRFKKNRNRPIDLLIRVRDREIPQVQSQIQAYNAAVDVYDAQRNAMILFEYVASRSKPVFRRSYGFEAFIEGLLMGIQGVHLQCLDHVQNLAEPTSFCCPPSCIFFKFREELEMAQLLFQIIIFIELAHDTLVEKPFSTALWLIWVKETIMYKPEIRIKFLADSMVFSIYLEI